MQKLASWLTASTLNAALAAAGLFIVAPPLAGAVCILMVLQRGLPAAVNVAALVVGAQVLIAVIAAAVFAAEAAANPAGYALFVALSLGLMLGVGLLLARLRSVTLVAQVIVLAGVAAVLFFSAGIVDLPLLLRPWTSMA